MQVAPHRSRLADDGVPFAWRRLRFFDVEVVGRLEH